MDLTGILLIEIYQTEKDKHHDTTYMQSLKKIETKTWYRKRDQICDYQRRELGEGG